MNRPRAFGVNAPPRAAVAAQQFVANFGPDFKVSRPDGRTQPCQQDSRLERRAPAPSPRSRRRQDRASPHAPRPPPRPIRPRTAPAGNPRQESRRCARAGAYRRRPPPRMADPRGIQIGDPDAVHLSEPARLRRKPRRGLKPPAILRDRLPADPRRDRPGSRTHTERRSPRRRAASTARAPWAAPATAA